MAASSGAVITAFVLNLAICIVCFLLFSFLRRWRPAIRFYAPKRFLPGNTSPLPPPPGDGLFSWLGTVLRIGEPDIINTAGLDTAMYLRVLSYGVELFLYVSVWCCLAMLPTNITGDEVDTLMAKNNEPGSTTNYKFTNFDKLSLANIPPGDPKLWVHMGSVYFVTIVAIWLLNRYSKESVLLRIMFLACSQRGGASHTVLVQDIPAVVGAVAQRAKEDRKKRGAEKKASKRSRSKGVLSTSAPSSAPGSGGGAGAELTTPRPGGAASGSHSPASYDAPSPQLMSARSSEAGESEAGPSRQLPVSRPASAEQVDIELALHQAAAKQGPGPVAEGSESPVSVSVSDASRSTARKRSAYAYDLTDDSFDPLIVAKKALKQHTVAEMVEAEFVGVHGGGSGSDARRGVDVVNLVCDLSKLQPLVEEYEKVRQALDDTVDAANAAFAAGKEVCRPKATLIMPLLGPWGKEKYGGGLIKRVDAYDHFAARLAFLEEEIEKEQERARLMAWPSAFVTFRTRLDQAIASSSLHTHSELHWTTQPAPAAFELVWGNLGMTKPVRTLRTMLMWAAFWLMTMFFMIPVAAVQGLIEATKFDDTPVIGPFLSNPVIAKLLEAIIPGLALTIFLALVPTILRIMVTQSGVPSQSAIDFGVVSRFFIFQVIVVFFGSVVLGSFFNQVKQWIEDPASVISVLGTAIPMTVTFFITYILIQLSTKPIGYSRAVGLILYFLFSWLSGSPKAQARLWQEQYTTLGTTVVDHTIVLLLGVIFSVINPIITPVALLYFAINLAWERYNHVYIYRRNYESGGKLWPRVCIQVFTALYIFQLTLIGLLAIKKFPFVVLLIPAPLGTLAFQITLFSSFRRPWALMSLHDAAELDRLDVTREEEEAKEMARERTRRRAQRSLAGAPPGSVADATPAQAELDEAEAEQKAEDHRQMYLNPGFKVKRGELEPLLEEARRMAARIDVHQEELAQSRAAKKAAKEAQGGGGGCLGGRRRAAFHVVDAQGDQESGQGQAAVAGGGAEMTEAGGASAAGSRGRGRYVERWSETGEAAPTPAAAAV